MNYNLLVTRVARICHASIANRQTVSENIPIDVRLLVICVGVKLKLFTRCLTYSSIKTLF